MDGTIVRVTPQGQEKDPGICISLLVPGGLAESRGLLLEVNGITMASKTLYQVTNMMVSNSYLIVPVRPANPGIFISRLVPGGLAESTGCLLSMMKYWK